MSILLDTLLVEAIQQYLSLRWRDSEVAGFGRGFPSTGEYVIPDGLSTLHIDRETDTGIYRAERMDAA